ncbi:MAG: ribulokinase, partial [Fimbriimonadaceae bacterium]
RFAIGVDYGTNSVRALIVDCADGREVATAVFAYPSGTDGIILDPQDPNLARQNPADYIEGFEAVVADAVRAAAEDPDFSVDRIVGIGIDATGSTPLPVAEDGTPLAMLEPFKENPAAMAWLWKDHTSWAEAEEITRRANDDGRPYLAKCGGTYSSEWFWSKILRCARTSPEVFEAAFSWVELCDFVPGFVTSNRSPLRTVRSVCAAGHKAMYAKEWGGLPSHEFLELLDDRLASLRERLYDVAYPSDHRAGELSVAVAERVGLPAGIPVATGALDAHMGAVGSGVRPGVLVKILGTSSCDIAVSADPDTPDIPGVCGIVDGSVVPGMLGIEAGQSAVGDLFNWFVRHLCPSEFAGGDAHANLSRAAARLKPGESGLLALDWNNGNRTVLVDPLLTGLMVGQTLHTSAPEVYRALIEATAFGARKILQQLERYGVTIDEVVACGGIADKSPFAMQIYADVLDRPMKTSRSSQTCALGAAIFGAVVGGAYPTVESAQAAMTGTGESTYTPNSGSAEVYRSLYALYESLHDAFGTTSFDGNLFDVMKELIAIRNRARSA